MQLLMYQLRTKTKMKQFIYYSILLLVFCYVPEIYGFPKVDFKRRVDILMLQTLPEPNSSVNLLVFIRKFNRTCTVINGNATLSEDFGSSYRFQLGLDLWGDGGWKKNIVHYEKNNPCAELKFVLGGMWNNILEAADVPRDCPIPKGFYQIKDYNVDASNVPLIFNTGRFKLNVDIFNRVNVIVLRVIVEVQIVALYSK